MTRRLRCLCLTLALTGLLPLASASAAGGGGGSGAPGPGPSGAGSAALTHGRLVTGAGGTYLPITPTDIVPDGSDPPNPLRIPPKGPNPQGMSCPTTSLFHVGPGSPAPGGGVVAVIAIHPTFTRNAGGGYDGSDARFAYTLRNAIPAGGDPTATSPGSLATEANVIGHVVAVTAFLRTRGTWEDAQPVAPFGGSCVGASFTFSAPYLAGDAPPPTPPPGMLTTPPFPTGAPLAAALTAAWTIGSVATLPGPAPTARTFVHIPTCAWTQSDVPAQPAALHALSAAVVGGYTLFLLYDVVVTPGPVTWRWGDGTSSTAAGPVEHAPTSLPRYDPSTQMWTAPCAVSHAYDAVSGGVTITASETFRIAITVSWSDGLSVHTQPVACDAVSGGACSIALGPANGWSSGPHAVDQIEPVPFAPPTPAP
ncbi:MAG TPA: hypothetical protein VND88_04760 [Candidatus Acidoferrales bacterium]|nr:hypothetical protein [Candidatus Acidoferrales bacterium]